MLECQDGGRGEHRNLLTINDGLEGGSHRDLGLAVPDVATEQTVHRRGGLHIAFDVGDSRTLVGSQFIFERVLEFLLPMRIRTEGVAGHGLSRRIEFQ
jgi:hypothetical protein